MTANQSRGQLRLMTFFLGFIAVAVVGSILVGATFELQDPGLVAGGRTTSTAVPSTSQPPTTSAAPTTTSRTTTTTAATTTVAPTTSLEPTDSTLAPLVPRLVVQTEQDIATTVAPKIAFVTTLNGSGSGVLVDEDLLITNAHVIWPFRDIGVVFPGDAPRGGRVIGVDARADLALVRIVSSELPEPVEFGETRTLEEDDDVFVVGYPAVESFAPEPTVVPAHYRETVPWTFSGVSWTVADAPAVGGQSGGALLDEYGRLIGITTFGSEAELYSVTMEDLVVIVDSLRDAEDTVDERLPPRRGGQVEFDMELAGPWEQAAFVTWLTPGTESTLTSTAGVSWRALDAFGFELAEGVGELGLEWPSATPGIVLATSGGPTAIDVATSDPLIAIEDPDDGQAITFQDESAVVGGFVDVAGDRDWWLFDLDDEVDDLRVAVQAQTRVRITLYNRDTGAELAEVEHRRGFLFSDPVLEPGPLPAGPYVIAVEDIAAQFGTYSLELSK